MWNTKLCSSRDYPGSRLWQRSRLLEHWGHYLHHVSACLNKLKNFHFHWPHSAVPAPCLRLFRFFCFVLGSVDSLPSTMRIIRLCSSWLKKELSSFLRPTGTIFQTWPKTWFRSCSEWCPRSASTPTELWTTPGSRVKVRLVKRCLRWSLILGALTRDVDLKRQAQLLLARLGGGSSLSLKSNRRHNNQPCISKMDKHSLQI